VLFVFQSCNLFSSINESLCLCVVVLEIITELWAKNQELQNNQMQRNMEGNPQLFKVLSYEDFFSCWITGANAPNFFVKVSE
jgi:hypothetical protein